jgi:hypothetical protein
MVLSGPLSSSETSYVGEWRLLDRLPGWETLAAYRQTAPWFTRIASNIFNVLLRRPAYTYRKYGYFLITESWVASHFAHLLAGLQRVGLDHKDIGVYCEAHLTIDPHHGTELVDGFSHTEKDLTGGGHHQEAGNITLWYHP